jgi:DNA-binding response OmpR family regulator
MEQMKILVVDDEQDLCDILLFNLRASGYVAEAVYSAEQAMEKNLASYDLLLLDVMMPGLSGFELAERLKTDDSTARIPIIFLTAKDTEDDALHGFGIGADDYVTKPFSVREVMARVKAVLSRSTSSPKSQPMNLVYEGLSVDLIKKTASVDGNVVELTKTELELLCLFLSHRGQVFSRQELIEKVWPQNVVVTSRTIDVNITRMRKKIGRYAACIVARQGYGYLFEA